MAAACCSCCCLLNLSTLLAFFLIESNQRGDDCDDDDDEAALPSLALPLPLPLLPLLCPCSVAWWTCALQLKVLEEDGGAAADFLTTTRAVEAKGAADVEAATTCAEAREARSIARRPIGMERRKRCCCRDPKRRKEVVSMAASLAIPFRPPWLQPFRNAHGEA